MSVFLATFSPESSSLSKPTHSKQISDIYDLPNHHRRSLKENPSKSFVIHRRPIPTDNQLYNYKQKLDQESTIDNYQHTFEDESDDEQHSNDFPKAVSNVQPSAYYTSTTQVFLLFKSEQELCFFLLLEFE
jgi:hypothetical protein